MNSIKTQLLAFVGILSLVLICGCGQGTLRATSDGRSDQSPGAHYGATVPVVTHPQDERPYRYPLIPGTSEWKNATTKQRVESAAIPQSWINKASSWQLFQSAVGSPYFNTAWVVGYGLGYCYNVSRGDVTLSILSQVDTAPDFGFNCVRYIESLNVAAIASDDCSSSAPCALNYFVINYMASMDSSLNTMDQASIQKLFRIAVWDADSLCNSPDSEFMAAAPMRLIYIIYNKPAAFRGAFPPGVVLPTLTQTQSDKLEGGSLSEELIPNIVALKSALNLTSRP
jgi:hypothetical protein